jgi:hypothetical protein
VTDPLSVLPVYLADLIALLLVPPFYPDLSGPLLVIPAYQSSLLCQLPLKYFPSSNSLISVLIPDPDYT